MSWIWNVRLETGQTIDELKRIQTVTKPFHIRIGEDGMIAEIIPASDKKMDETGFDGDNLLALPAFKEMHNHLDKTYLSLEWKAIQKSRNLEHRLQLEAQELQELLPTVKQRASAMIERHLSNGVNYIRTHVNIDPYVGLDNLKGVKAALDEYSDYLTYDIVAFPQHGLLKHKELPDLLRESFKHGATMLGGLDPAGIDKNIEASLGLTMKLAKELGVDVDLHLHDQGHLGYYTMDQWLNMVEEHDYKGKTSFSHAFGLTGIAEKNLNGLIERFQKHNVSILSTVPLGQRRQIIPIDALVSNGIFVGLGCDGYYDSWSSFSTGDVLERTRNFSEYTGKRREDHLREQLALVTGGKTPLDKEANRIWPQVGDEASFVLVNAYSSAEAVARVTDQDKRILINKGNIYQKPWQE